MFIFPYYLIPAYIHIYILYIFIYAYISYMYIEYIHTPMRLVPVASTFPDPAAFCVTHPRNTGEHNVHPAHIQHVVVGQALSQGGSGCSSVDFDGKIMDSLVVSSVRSTCTMFLLYPIMC